MNGGNCNANEVFFYFIADGNSIAEASYTGANFRLCHIIPG